MELYPGPDSTDERLLTLNQCVHVSPEFAKAKPISSTAQRLPLAVYDAAACPDSLDLSDADFAAQYQNRVAVCLSGALNSATCYSSYFVVGELYKRMADAGALAVINVAAGAGHNAGIHADFFDRPESISIPFFSCANTDASAQPQVSAFVNSWLLDPSERVSPYNQPLFINNVTVSGNPWTELFHNEFYRITFRVIIPVLFLAVVGQATYYSYERLVHAKWKKGSYKAGVGPPLVAIQIEGWSTFILALFFNVDGMWSNHNSLFKFGRSLFLTQLLLLSVGSSVLVGLIFSDIRKSSQRLQQQHKTFAEKHRFKLIVIAALLVAMELMTMILRTVPGLYVFVNGVALLVGIGVGVWFVYEARGFSSLLLEMVNNSDPQRSDSSSTIALTDLLRHTRKYTYATIYFQMVIIILGCIMNFHPWLLWRVENWGPLWFVFTVVRVLFSAAKLELCRLPKMERRAKAKFNAGSYVEDMGAMVITVPPEGSLATSH